MTIVLNKKKKEYFEIPEGVWFKGDFTVEAFVLLPDNFSSWRTIMDFGNGPKSDNVVFALSEGWPFLAVLVESSRVEFFGTGSIPVGTWAHLAGTLEGQKAILYMNGAMLNTKECMPPRNVTRKANYIGKSNWEEKSFTTAYFRDIRLWQRALNRDEIMKSMKGILPADASLVGDWKIGIYNGVKTGGKEGSGKTEVIPEKSAKIINTLITPIRYEHA